MFISRARTVVFAGLTAATVALAVFAVAAKTTSIAIDSVSNRADLISGGDVLLRVTLPEGQAASAATLAVGGAAVPGALKPAPDGNGQLALVTGLPNGKSVVSVTAGGQTARLEVTNHPNGGPVFSGPPNPAVEVPGGFDRRAVQPSGRGHLVLHAAATARQFRLTTPRVRRATSRRRRPRAA